MINLNKYQKTQIILLVTIIIAAIVFIISLVKTKNSQQYSTEETFAEMTDAINKTEEEVEEEITEQPEDTSWDEENVEDTEVDMANEENKQENNSASYYIKVNYTANVVTIYTKDNEGKYTKPVKAMVCSTGTATPRSGVYKMSNKYRWHQLNGGVYGQYCSRITGHILFHSVPYKTNSPDTLKYTSYDKLGTAASAGCIRLTVADALWIYSNCPSGTYVEFYGSSNPGPLGKPTAKKISSNTTCRNWDPTDPLPNNPWHTYVEPTTTQTQEQQTQTTQNNNQESNKQEENKQENTQNNNNQNSFNENNNQKPNEEKPTTNKTNTSNTTNTMNTTTNTTNNTTENTVINTTTNTNVNTSSSTKDNTQTTDKTN